MLYWFIRTFGWYLFAFLGLKVIGRENIPPDGRVMIIANHNSNWDPLLIAFSFKRPICYMAKNSLFKYSLSDRFFRALHAFPVDRSSADRQAIRRAIEVLEQGKVLGIFPEGERTEVGTPVKAKKGAALIAVKARSPIVPVACVGTKRALPIGWFRDVKIVVGPPIYTEEIKKGKLGASVIDDLSNLLGEKIQTLLDQQAGIEKTFNHRFKSPVNF